MSKYQEALDCIIGMLNVLPFKRNKDFEKTIKELIDKETPMKPIDVNGGKYCRKCHQGLIINNFKLNSCNNLNCRQVVDWRNDE